LSLKIHILDEISNFSEERIDHNFFKESRDFFIKKSEENIFKFKNEKKFMEMSLEKGKKDKIREISFELNLKNSMKILKQTLLKS
jgi:hypothetical protein